MSHNLKFKFFYIKNILNQVSSTNLKFTCTKLVLLIVQVNILETKIKIFFYRTSLSEFDMNSVKKIQVLAFNDLNQIVFNDRAACSMVTIQWSFYDVNCYKNFDFFSLQLVRTHTPHIV